MGKDYAPVSTTSEESLIANVGVDAKQLSVQVTAPSDLQEGYSFNVKVDGRDAVVTVPQGGVKAGQNFVGRVTYIDDKKSSSRESIPVGAWRHGICDCCSYGFFHPLWIMACCYGALPLAQVQTRLNLNLFGHERETSQHGPSAFRVGMVLFVVWMASVRGLQSLYRMLAPDVLHMTFGPADAYDPESPATDSLKFAASMQTAFDLVMILFLVAASAWYRCFLDKPSSFRVLLGTLFIGTIGVDVIAFVVGFVAALQQGQYQAQQYRSSNIKVVDVPASARFVALQVWILIWAMRTFLLYAGTVTRSFIRAKYAIPGDSCGDCCCMCWCPCCTVIQMSTHTADYNKTPMDYGAEDGLFESNGDNYNGKKTMTRRNVSEMV